MPVDANYQLLVKGAAVSDSNPLPSADAVVGAGVGAVDDTAVTDPEADGSTIALLKGALTEIQALKALVGTADDVAGANTLIGQLKQIATNTTPAG
jgi:hypothetical protein